MSTDPSLVSSFMTIAGVSEGEAQRFLKMGKNNLEAALNYFFNKKGKDEKSTKKQTNAFEKLQQGSKNQANLEKTIKTLKKDVSSGEIGPSDLDPKKDPDTLKVTKYPTPVLDRFGSDEVRAEAQASKERVSPVRESAKKKGVKSEKERSAHKKMDSYNEDNEDNNDMLLGNAKPFETEYENNTVNLKDLPDLNENYDKENRDFSEENGKDLEEYKNQPDVIGKKPIKRNFDQFEQLHKAHSSPEQIEKVDHTEKMVIEDDTWPKYLGVIAAKGSIMSIGKRDIREGDVLQLRREKQVLNAPKKGLKNKVVTSGAAIVRVLHKEEEIGKLDVEYSHTLAPLLDKNYIFVDATVKSPPSSFTTFSPFWVNVNVFLPDTAVSKPLTEIISFRDNSKDEEDRLLQELQYTKDAFVALFDMLNLRRITDTLIKRLPARHAAKHSSDSNKKIAKSPTNNTNLDEDSNSRNNFEEKKVDIFDPFQRIPQQKSLANFVVKKNPAAESSTTEHSDQNRSAFKTEQVANDETNDINYEKFLNLENEDYSELKLSEPPTTFVSNLHPYQKQALTWMLSREGCNEKLYSKLVEKTRVIHPLWEEYVLKDNTHLYFNPYTGQVSKEIPKAAPDCLGGILADEMGLGKTVMMIALLHSHKYDREDKTIFKKQAEKKRKLNAGAAGQSSITSAMKSPLKPAGTLIVVPVTLIAQWESELDLHSFKKSFKTFVYYGDKRSDGKGDLGRFDVVLTTYGVLSNESASAKDKELYKYEWFRIVLDEAHYIKGRTIQTAKAVYELSGIHKWCLSGTPIQNKLDDLFSLIHFLKLEPWSDYVWWNTYINKPNEKNDPIVFQILQTILRPILLRRTKKTQTKDGNFIIQLPEKKSKIEYITLPVEERDFYDSLFKQSKTEFDKFVEEGTLVSHYAHVFELLLRLRQTCDHPFLIYSNPDVKGRECLEEEITKFIEKKEDEVNGSNDDDEENNERPVVDKKKKKSPAEDKGADDNNDHYEIIMDENANNEQLIPVQNSGNLFNKKYLKETIERLKKGELDNCVVCLGDIEDAVITVCSHVLCRYCLIRAIDSTSMCPICRTILTRKDFMTVPRESRFSFDIDKKYKRSAKVESLFAHIQEVIDKKEKCVVFSQFIGMLMLIEHDLKAHNIKYVRLDGSLAQKKRAEVLEEFKKDNTIHVFLISLKAGGVGLNLVVANHAFLVDPWWNPAVEEQAVERVHRIGQKKPVEVIRFICRETVEERIVELHSYKKELFDSTITFNQEERKAMNAENFKYLMQTYK